MAGRRWWCGLGRSRAPYYKFSVGGDDPETISDLERELEAEMRLYDHEEYPNLQYLSSGEESDESDDGLWNEEDRLSLRMALYEDEFYQMLEEDEAACNAEREEQEAREAVDDSHRIIRHEREVEEWPECAPRQYDETQVEADFRFRVMTILQQWWRGV